ncbi:LOW QUALITY PROTEIN: hypothetical protein HID58_087671, partial [Brassica napus]
PLGESAASINNTSHPRRSSYRHKKRLDPLQIQAESKRLMNAIINKISPPLSRSVNECIPITSFLRIFNYENFNFLIHKLPNSKHLFFKEMCAYHNICGHLDQPSQHRREQQSCYAERIAESEEEEYSDMVEDWSRMEQTSKKQRRGEGVWVELKLMREETAWRVVEGVGAGREEGWVRVGGGGAGEADNEVDEIS